MATLLPDPEPRPRHVAVVSVDDHLIEPADLFEGRLPARLAPHAPRVVTEADGTEAVIRVAYDEDWAALSCLAVRPTSRRAGLGRELTLRALAAARARGARRAFLQVETRNLGAARLYGALGFHPADTYRYRQL